MSWLRGFALASAAIATLGLAAPAAAAPRSGAAQRKTTMGKVVPRGRENAEPGARDAPRRPAKHRKSDRRVAPVLCVVTPTTIDRGLGREVRQIELVDCEGKPAAGGRRALSIMARLRGSPIPKIADGEIVPELRPKPRPGEVSRGVRLVDPGLLVRLRSISEHFGAKPLSVVSGYRPQSNGSLHQHAKALDIRVHGVANTEVVAFCRTLADTGCGYYPNSTFVHVDVRKKGTGSVSWIDASGPGEPARYVKQWPPPEPKAPKAPARRAKPRNGPSGPAKHTKPQVATKARAG